MVDEPKPQTLEEALGAVYRTVVLEHKGRSEAVEKLRLSLKTDADLRAKVQNRRSAMTDDVQKRDFISRTLAPVIDEALNGLEDGTDSARSPQS